MVFSASNVVCDTDFELGADGKTCYKFMSALEVDEKKTWNEEFCNTFINHNNAELLVVDNIQELVGTRG